MLRLQTALPDRYTTADPGQLAAWIAQAKSVLGRRVFILGHHYQRDEVMAWADARGDSFGLSRIAADQTEAYDQRMARHGINATSESSSGRRPGT